MTRSIKIAGLFLSLLAVGMPLAALASSNTDCLWGGGCWGPILSCTAAPQAGSTITTQCSSLCDLLSTGQNIFLFILSVYFYIVVPAFVMYGGALILVSGDSQKRRDEGREVIKRAVVGLFIAMGSFVIVGTFFWLVGISTDPSAAKSGVAWPDINCVK